MNRKLKLALAALLGFSTACSTVKNAPSKGAADDAERPVDSVRTVPPIIVMYGVRTPTKPIPRPLDSDVQPESATTDAPAAQPSEE